MRGTGAADKPGSKARDQRGNQRDLPPGLAAGKTDEEAKDGAGHRVRHQVLKVRVQQRGGNYAPDSIEVQRADAVIG